MALDFTPVFRPRLGANGANYCFEEGQTGYIYTVDLFYLPWLEYAEEKFEVMSQFEVRDFAMIPVRSLAE